MGPADNRRGFAAITAAFAVALPCAVGVPGAFAMSDNADHATTDFALQCLLGILPKGCEKVFENPASLRYDHCAGEYVWRRQDNCPNGPLERVEYLGTNAAGNNVYSVSWMHVLHSLFVLPPAGPDGKVGPLRRRPGDVRVASKENQTIYIRPKENGSVE